MTQLEKPGLLYWLGGLVDFGGVELLVFEWGETEEWEVK